MTTGEAPRLADTSRSARPVEWTFWTVDGHDDTSWAIRVSRDGRRAEVARTARADTEPGDPQTGVSDGDLPPWYALDPITDMAVGQADDGRWYLRDDDRLGDLPDTAWEPLERVDVRDGWIEWADDAFDELAVRVATHQAVELLVQAAVAHRRKYTREGEAITGAVWFEAVRDIPDDAWRNAVADR